jgi:hypothetical protein
MYLRYMLCDFYIVLLQHRPTYSAAIVFIFFIFSRHDRSAFHFQTIGVLALKLIGFHLHLGIIFLLEKILNLSHFIFVKIHVR